MLLKKPAGGLRQREQTTRNRHVVPLHNSALYGSRERNELPLRSEGSLESCAEYWNQGVWNIDDV